jgi:hypothetical protein
LTNLDLSQDLSEEWKCVLEEPLHLISKSTLCNHFQCSLPTKEILDAFNKLKKKQFCALKKCFVHLHNDNLCRYKKESCLALAILALNTSQNHF